MRGVSRPEPKFVAIYPGLNARRLSVRTETPGDIYHFGCEAFFGQNRNFWRYCPACVRGDCRSEPKFLAIVTNLNSRCLSVRIQIPGKLPICMRGVCRSGPKFLAVFSSLSARRYPIRTEVPGGIYQATWEAFFGRGQSPWRYLPV